MVHVCSARQVPAAVALIMLYEAASLSMKRALLRSRFGAHALWLRGRAQLFGAALGDSEAIGTLSNDLLASRLIARLCRPRKIAIDVGAHIGSVVADIQRSCEEAQVIAIEAMPEKATRLKRSFPRAVIHCIALGETDGVATFFVNTRRTGYSSLGRPAPGLDAGIVSIEVPVGRLDGLLSSDQVDVVKIDVEGAELGVLRGGEGVIRASRPIVMFESGPAVDNGLGYSKESLWDWFASRGYAILVPNRVAHEDHGLSREAFIESHLYPRRTTNYFAVPSEFRTEVMLRARNIIKGDL